MARSYSNAKTLIQTKLADTAGTNFLSAEVDFQMAEGLKEFATYRPHIVNLPFKIESRSGTDVTSTADKLTDTVKTQFVSTDSADEKVIHNTTQSTWAVCTAYDSTSVLSISDDIMNANDNYRLYNKKCTSEKQVYIGDILPHSWEIDSVEYPIGQKRNWEIVSEGVLEVDVDSVDDSNANTAITGNLPNVDVLVRAKRPHVLSQLTDFAGAISATTSAKAATTINVISLAASASIELGAELKIATHRQNYIITATATANSAGAVTLSLYPPLEVAAASASVVTFISSTLKPNDEEIYADLVAARCAIDKASKYIPGINITGQNTWSNYQSWGERKLAQVLGALRHQRQTTIYPSDR